METCIFCKIAKKEITSEIIAETKLFLAFLDINPINKGHALIIPKKHTKNISEMQEPELSNILKFTQEVAKKIKETLNCDGYNIGMNTDLAAGQTIFHTHIHIIPRYANDNLKSWPHKKYEENEIKNYTKKLKL